MKNEKVISKIQKLLALSTSSNENEAASALAKAQELLDRENLSLFEIEGFTDSAIESFLIDSKARFLYWEQMLFKRLAESSDCFPYSETYRGQIKLWIVGFKQDSEAFVYYFNFLKKIILILSNKAMAKEKRSVGAWDRKRAFRFRNSFGVGATIRVCERMDQIRQERLSQNVTCRALVVSRKQDIATWISSNLKLRHQSKKTALSQRGFDKGYEAGNGISLHEGISDSSKLRLEGGF